MYIKLGERVQSSISDPQIWAGKELALTFGKELPLIFYFSETVLSNDLVDNYSIAAAVFDARWSL